ncbi:hypothetical protein JW964_09215, partial [candidate division KSB1 bacterium]|nr:hypothetical protein [candidate division KSB1 bacterium]
MNPTLIAGTRIVVLALIFYSIGIITEQRKHRIINLVLIALTIGIVLDITATAFMITGSPNSPFTLHGFLGYSALLVMLIDTIFVWRFRLANGNDSEVSKPLHLYSRYAYSWWVIAFVSGSVLVVLK